MITKGFRPFIFCSHVANHIGPSCLHDIGTNKHTRKWIDAGGRGTGGPVSGIFSVRRGRHGGRWHGRYADATRLPRIDIPQYPNSPKDPRPPELPGLHDPDAHFDPHCQKQGAHDGPQQKRSERLVRKSRVSNHM